MDIQKLVLNKSILNLQKIEYIYIYISIYLYTIHQYICWYMIVCLCSYLFL